MRMNHYHLSRYIANNAILEGTFTLNSGETSNIYFDKYKLLSHPDAISGAVAELLYLFCSDDTIDFDWLVAPELGGAILAAMIQQELSIRGCRVGLSIVRNEAKDHGTGDVILAPPTKYRKAIIIDDVITSGKAINHVLCKLSELDFSPEIVQIIALVDRTGVGVNRLRDQGYFVSTVFNFEELTQRAARNVRT